jgi:hypothetical protein
VLLASEQPVRYRVALALPAADLRMVGRRHRQERAVLDKAHRRPAHRGGRADGRELARYVVLGVERVDRGHRVDAVVRREILSEPTAGLTECATHRSHPGRRETRPRR